MGIMNGIIPKEAKIEIELKKSTFLLLSKIKLNKYPGIPKTAANNRTE